MDRSKVKNRPGGSSKKTSVANHQDDDNFLLFDEDSIPPHHFGSVRQWLEQLLDEFVIFSKSFDSRVKRNQTSKIFFSKNYDLEDINVVVKNCHRVINSSISSLCEFRSSMEDYVSSWKALKNEDGDGSSESSVEVSNSPVAGSAHSDSPSDKDKSSSDIDSRNNETSTKYSTETNTEKLNEDDTSSSKPESEVVLPKIRVKKLQELMSEPSHDSSSKAPQPSFRPADTIYNSSSDECVVVSEVKADTRTNEQLFNGLKNSLKLKLSKNIEPKDNKKLKTESKECVIVTTSSDNSDEDPLRSVKESTSSKEKELPLKSEPQEKKTETKINWSSSSSESTERDWVITSKKKKSEDSSKKKKLKTKKDLNKTRKSRSRSSSEEDLSKLCNIDSLSRKRKLRSSSSSSADSSKKSEKESKTKKKSNKDVKKKIKDEKLTLDFSDEQNSNKSSGSSSEVDLTFDCNDLKLLAHEQKKKSRSTFSDLLESGKVVSGSSDDTLDLLTDDSLDELVEELVSRGQKVRRGGKVYKKSELEKESSDKLGKETSESDEGNKKKNKPRYRDKLLTEKLTDTDTTEGEERWQKAKMKKKIESSDSEVEVPTEKKVVADPNKDSDKIKRRRKQIKKSLFSDSDEQINESSDSDEKENSDEESKKVEGEENEDEEEKKDSEDEKKTKKRKRIQRHSDSSEDDDEAASGKTPDGKGRRNIRKVLKEDSLEKSTKEALKEEEERKKRIAEKQRLYNELMRKVATQEAAVIEELVLDFDEESKKPLVSVDKDLVKKLKPHQAQGVKFMWDSCFESVKEAKKSPGSGCILAHCMGLGKTLQVITLIHTILTNDNVDVNRVLVVAPFSTVQNWVNEFRKWLKDVGSGEDFEIYDMLKTAPNHRAYQLRDWERTGGVMVLGYNLFRTLVSPTKRMKPSIKKAIAEVLIDPGPDVVVCDEGHILKNEKTAVNVAMSKLKTRRRIVLTGTPLQNNLIEYHCMVQFVKPNLLGTKKEFQNRFVHPIQNGQFEDSTAHDVKIMKRRAHVLHKMLDGIVQRKDYNVLTPYLPPKFEYVIHVKLSEVQIKLYRYFLENMARKNKSEGGGLFQDFQHLMRICTHPRSLLIHSDKEIIKRELEQDDSEGSLKDFIDDDSESKESDVSSDESNSASGSDRSKTPPSRRRSTRAARAAGEISEPEEEEVAPKRTEWWSEIVSEEELTDIKSSPKLFLFFTILKHCEEMGDKLLVFSQSLYTLDLIEHFLELVDDNSRKSEDERNPALSEFCSNWDKGLDYFRLDGGTTSDNRANWCKIFNKAENTRARLFLISTRAGGLGINLTGANRVIIFDASWNPSYDVQSIFRVYRFGQTKPCYVYRFLSKGTMEEKIYERQVAKLSTSLRVIDEQQIDRHFTQTSLAELYAFNPDEPEDRETPQLPKDRLMAELVQNFPSIILKHHEHDSLLENQEAEELNEEERKAAWVEFENEKNNVPPPNPYLNMNQGTITPSMSFNIQAQMIVENLIQKIRAQNPNVSEELIKQRAVEALQQMPFWRNQQAQYYQQQQQQQQQQQNILYQQQYLRQQQLMYAQQQQLLQQQQQMQQKNRMSNAFATLLNNGQSILNKAPATATATATNTLKEQPSTSTGSSSSQPIEIQDD